MNQRWRHVAIVAVSGMLAAVLTLLGAAWATGVFDEPEVDGEFELVEPGIFDQPVDDLNDDSAGRLVPDVPLVDASGNEVGLERYAGGPFVINVWFSSCVPCARELKDFAEVDAELGDEVRFVGLNPFDTAETMQRFASERGVTYDLLRDVNFAFVNELEIVAYPVTLFVDGDGRILRQVGEVDADELRSTIDEVF